MAELDEISAQRLCAALAASLSEELGRRVLCVPVVGAHLQWDLEARDPVTGEALRRISCVSSVPERLAMAQDQLANKFWHDLERSLRELAVFDCHVHFSVRNFPTTKPERRHLAKGLAQRVRDHLVEGTPIIEDPVECIRAGRHPFNDLISRHLHDVEVLQVPATGAARVFSAMHDGLTWRVPPLHEEILPVIATKMTKHGAVAVELTLVVELALAAFSDEAVGEVRGFLTSAHRGFLSLYVCRLPKVGEVRVGRVY